ncbi:hypothetical protein RHO14_03230 [Orbus wheelerorum]|uniref:hypothetical protein n=1 Tax=Orbus wheelerorum TaxID=3074111 RepID=UPI00370DCDEC
MSKNGLIFLLEGNKYIQIHSWDDILNRPNFVTSFDPQGKELADVIGEYSFKEKLSCCLTNCNQPHNYGYLVLTSTGEETYIGNICGKKIFGEINFKSKTRSFDRSLKVSQAKQSLLENKDKLTFWFDRLNSLKPVAKIILKKMTQISNIDQVGSFARSEFSNMMRLGNGRIIWIRKADQHEIDVMKLQGRSPPYEVEELIGVVSYTSVLSDANNLKNLLLVELEETLIKLSLMPPDIDDEDFILETSKKVNNIENCFNQVTSILDNSKKFFTEENLKPILNKMIKDNTIPNNDKNIKIFRTFLRSLT